ncbi:HNH endonuclease [Nocardia higoensis]|uniref:HNH endonuclease n=1 Tax=Nocardia higoensis TaxID=228599 RepID=A0ABS0DHK4_9NOCA|nr:HNH endonuclease [Nocardia higoensis]MBF6357904.1 HNH endonuclease [Nocardia higoensis]
MWSLEPPKVTVHETASTCAEQIANQGLAERVLAARAQLTDNSAKLQYAARSDQLYLIDRTMCAVAELDDDELTDLYTNHLSRKRKRAREHYDAIMSGALDGLCSYCQYGIAKQLDHFVPKTRVPGLAIDPWNLVPSCADCNHRLRNTYASSPEGQLLHPYAMPVVGRWLHAHVPIEQLPVNVEFFADPDAVLDDGLQKRIRNQFEVLGLAELYATVVSRELTTATRRLVRLFSDAETSVIRAHLREAAVERGMPDPNAHVAVMYEALSESDWYCTEGFRAEEC